jgi:hypothetical protein
MAALMLPRGGWGPCQLPGQAHSRWRADCRSHTPTKCLMLVCGVRNRSIEARGPAQGWSLQRTLRASRGSLLTSEPRGRPWAYS